MEALFRREYQGEPRRCGKTLFYERRAVDRERTSLFGTYREHYVAYPSVLVLASEKDARVDAMHARKFAAALQAASTGGWEARGDVACAARAQHLRSVSRISRQMMRSPGLATRVTNFLRVLETSASQASSAEAPLGNPRVDRGFSEARLLMRG